MPNLPLSRLLFFLLLPCLDGSFATATTVPEGVDEEGTLVVQVTSLQEGVAVTPSQGDNDEEVTSVASLPPSTKGKVILFVVAYYALWVALAYARQHILVAKWRDNYCVDGEGKVNKRWGSNHLNPDVVHNAGWIWTRYYSIVGSIFVVCFAWLCRHPTCDPWVGMGTLDMRAYFVLALPFCVELCYVVGVVSGLVHNDERQLVNRAYMYVPFLVVISFSMVLATKGLLTDASLASFQEGEEVQLQGQEEVPASEEGGLPPAEMSAEGATPTMASSTKEAA